jgi:hypothetical protein
MSHILLKQVPTSAITTPAATYVKFFSNFDDNGLLYYKDDSGNAVAVGSGGGSTYVPVTEITYTDLYTLYSSNGFATSSYYLITDFDSVYDQPDFYCDGTPKTVVDNKGKPSGWAYQPILVMATSKNTLSPDAYQPPASGFNGFPKDKIKYDFTWNKTEFNVDAKGRIVERIDEYGNRTDFDHRAIRFKRYQNYTKNVQLTGIITDYDCTNGTVAASGASFSTELSVGDIIIIDSKSDLGYDIGLKVDTIISDGSLIAVVDSLYNGTVPSSVTLNSGTVITPQDYSFSAESYDFYSTTATGDYTQYKEVYFGQSDANDCDKEVYPFQITSSFNNKIGNYSQVYLSGANNVFILPNNVFKMNCNNNVILDNFYNNHIGENFFDNNIGYNFSKNVINDNFSRNTTVDTFSSNLISNNFKWNNIQTGVSGYDFSSATHVYGNYNCNIFSNSLGYVRLSYYNSSDVLVITNVNS